MAPAHAQDMSKFPDWSGQWKKPNGVGNQWDLSKPPGRAQQAPLTPEYQAIYEARLADRAAGGLGGDPTGQCIPHGLPRMMIGIYPMELVVTPKTTYLLSDYNEPRRIFTDGRNWPKEIEPTFNGYSIGKWIDEEASGRYNVPGSIPGIKVPAPPRPDRHAPAWMRPSRAVLSSTRPMGPRTSRSR